MKFTESERPFTLDIEHLIVAGWTGRNQQAVEHHIKELAEIGVAPPSQTPLFYRVSVTLLTREEEVEMLGEATSGEVEPVLFKQDGTIWLGLGSDHTDRELEAVSVAASKQASPKPVAGEVWKFDEVRDHLDEMILICQIEENGEWVKYQQGTLASIRPLQDLLQLSDMPDRSAMLCGTLPAIGSVRPAKAYRMELRDPVLKRSLNLDYRVRTLPIVN